MRFLLFKSEVVAQEVAWQLRAISLKKFVILFQSDPQALKLAIALAGSKPVKSWRLFDFIAIICLLSLVSFRIVEQFNHPDQLKIFTEDQLTRLYICTLESLNKLQLEIDCDQKQTLNDE